MDKKKENKIWFKIIMIALFIAYISLYVINKSGYYDGNMRNKVQFTEEQIEKFEEDIAAGEKVDIKRLFERSKQRLYEQRFKIRL